MIEIHLKRSLIKVTCCTENLLFCQSEDLRWNHTKWKYLDLDATVLAISVAHIFF